MAKGTSQTVAHGHLYTDLYTGRRRQSNSINYDNYDINADSRHTIVSKPRSAMKPIISSIVEASMIIFLSVDAFPGFLLKNPLLCSAFMHLTIARRWLWGVV